MDSCEFRKNSFGQDQCQESPKAQASEDVRAIAASYRSPALGEPRGSVRGRSDDAPESMIIRVFTSLANKTTNLYLVGKSVVQVIFRVRSITCRAGCRRWQAHEEFAAWVVSDNPFLNKCTPDTGFSLIWVIHCKKKVSLIFFCVYVPLLQERMQEQ